MSKLKQLGKLAQKKLENVDPVTAARYLILTLALVSAWVVLTSPLATKPEDATVMIVRNDRRSGGTGVVLTSSAQESKVLTNAHVCGLLSQGGLVINPKQEKHTVTSYKVSKNHDLCLITVSADLHYNTKVSEVPPTITTPAKIAGHPSLLPMVVTRGHYSDTQIIQVFVGTRKCEQKDLEDETIAPFCSFFGRLPIVRTYEAQLVTATIMPGSSGSAVYNDKGELTNLVFAGSGGIGYAFTVPHGFVSDFLNKEAPMLESNLPAYELDIAQLLGERSRKDSLRSLGEICNDKDINPKLKELCDVIIRDLEWRKAL